MSSTRRRSSLPGASTLAMLPPARSPGMDNPVLSTLTSDSYTQSTPGLHRHPHNLSPRHSDLSRDSPFSYALTNLSQTSMPLNNTYSAASPVSYAARLGRWGSLPFDAQENYCKITCEGTNVVPYLQASSDKGFFRSSDGDWVCYRRNYFAVNVSYNLTPWIPNARLYLGQGNNRLPEQIQSMAVSLAAALDGARGKSIELIQHTPKRDKGQQVPMKKEILAPTPAGKNNDHDSFQSSSQVTGPQLPLQGDFKPWQQYSSTSHTDGNYQHAFERIQFKSATANNGKRRAQQQYYYLIVELWANIQHLPNLEPRWVRIAAKSSHRVVVRGRSPSHYQNDNLDNLNASRSTGSSSMVEPGHHEPDFNGEATYGGSYRRGLSGSWKSVMIGDGHKGATNPVDSSPVGSYSASPPSSSSGGHVVDTVDKHVVQEDNLKIKDTLDYQYYPAPISETIPKVGVESNPIGGSIYSGDRGYLGSSPVRNQSLKVASKDGRYIVQETSPTSKSQELRLEVEENVSSQLISPDVNEALYSTNSAEIPEQAPSTPLIKDEPHMPEALGHPSAQTYHWMFNSLNYVIQSLRYPLQILECSWQPPIPLGYVRVSWTCRCSKRLYADFEKKHQAAAVEFEKQAAGPSNESTVSSSCSESDTSSASSKNRSSNSWKSSPEGDIPETPPSSMSSTSDSQLDSIIPDENKRYLLLCVNSEIHRIDLVHVDLTPKYEYGIPARKDDQTLFKDVKEEYAKLRSNKAKNILIVPKTIQFIKFELIYRRLSGECVGNFEIDKIPSKQEAKEFGYHFTPCPPDIGKLPIMPHIFMHSFREPGDHTGSLVVERLPKKVGERLSSQEYPGVGWGIYVIEGYNWKLLRKCVIGALFGTFILMLLWSILKKDVQGGAGIGQYSVAVLALALPVYVLEQSSDH